MVTAAAAPDTAINSRRLISTLGARLRRPPPPSHAGLGRPLRVVGEGERGAIARHSREFVSRAYAHVDHGDPHSITSSARARRVGGIVRPSAFAVLRLIVSSYRVACSTGRSEGLKPLRIRSTKVAARRVSAA